MENSRRHHRLWNGHVRPSYSTTQQSRFLAAPSSLKAGLWLPFYRMLAATSSSRSYWRGNLEFNNEVIGGG
jgi:hypothetical protein